MSYFISLKLFVSYYVRISTCSTLSYSKNNKKLFKITIFNYEVHFHWYILNIAILKLSEQKKKKKKDYDYLIIILVVI